MSTKTENKDDNRLDQLWAMQEIRNLAYRYAYAMDTLDLPLMESLWVKTREPVPMPTIDIHLIRQMHELLAGRASSTLFVGNHLITFDGPDRAHGSVYCLAFIDWGCFIDQSIVYQDVYERHDGKWLFLTRDHLLSWGQERASNPMHQDAANWPVSQVGAGNAFEVLRYGLPVKPPAPGTPQPFRIPPL